MSLDHEAIRKAYPNVVTIDDSGQIEDSSGNQVIKQIEFMMAQQRMLLLEIN